MPDRKPRSAARLGHPVVLAALVTLANVPKPAVVDDTAYLMFARHIAGHPADPYGFEHFWYSEPEPAWKVLAPPVVPYWLAAGMRLFGENLILLKLWLYPFPLILAYAARFLLRRFAPESEPLILPAVVLGPGVLPFLNLMLDVPALALQTAAVALFVRGTDGRGSAGLVLAAGVLAGAACQTKYSALAVPAVIGWYGVTRRRVLPAVAAVAAGVAVFAAWEWFLAQKYGVSHFVFHLTEEVRAAGPEKPRTAGVGAKLAAEVGRKIGLVTPMLGHLGVTAWWVGTLTWLGLGVRPRLVRGTSLAAAAVAVVLLVLPGRWAALVPGPDPALNRLTVHAALFVSLGSLAPAAGVIAAAVLVSRRGAGPAGRVRRSADAWFLAGWLAIEVGASLALTPFPAARRVLGVSFVLAVVAAALWSRVRRTGSPPAVGWVGRAAVATGVALAALDTFDAYPEADVPRRAAEVARERGWPGTGWYVGHWGFQHYCEREGMRPLVPGRSELRPGDWVALPVYPDAVGFYRPSGWVVGVRWDGPDVVPDVELIWDDLLSAQTVPNLYGGKTPVVGRKHPRLRVVLFRVVRPCRA